MKKAYSYYCRINKVKKLSEKQFNITIKQMFPTSSERKQILEERIWVWQSIRLDQMFWLEVKK